MIHRQILLRMRNAGDKSCREIQNILCSITFFKKSCSLWDNVEKYDGARGATNDVTIWRIRAACWISKATCTHARAHMHKYVIFIAFPRQWSRTRLSVTLYVHWLCPPPPSRAVSFSTQKFPSGWVCLNLYKCPIFVLFIFLNLLHILMALKM